MITFFTTCDYNGGVLFMPGESVYNFLWGSRSDPQVLIVHLGSKSTPLISQALRELGVCSQVISHQEFERHLDVHIPKVVILSGGPSGVYERKSPKLYKETLTDLVNNYGVLLVGICYGAQLLAHIYGGIVVGADKIESAITDFRGLFENISLSGRVVMNHGDQVAVLPETWENFGATQGCCQAFFGDGQKIFGLQFHPEMDHTDCGQQLLSYLLFQKTDCKVDYNFDPEEFVVQAGQFLRLHIGDDQVLVAFSGGVDSVTAWKIACQTLGQDKVQAIFVDNGYMRKNELDQVRNLFGTYNIQYIQASEQFYNRVAKIQHTGNEADYFDRVRRVIGETFIGVFVEQAKSLPGIKALVQGTNNADIIESLTDLKRHHNVGALPEVLPYDVLNPLAGLYKFEIRKLAKYLGLPEEVVWRQPFPGPGNAIRTWGVVTPEKAKVLGEANYLLEKIIEKYYPNYQDRPCQYYVALVPLESCGLIGDKRMYGPSWQLRAVSSQARESYATLNRFHFTEDCLDEIVQRLTNEITMPDGTPFVRVVYDLTSKPPATTEPH